MLKLNSIVRKVKDYHIIGIPDRELALACSLLPVFTVTPSKIKYKTIYKVQNLANKRRTSPLSFRSVQFFICEIFGELF